MKKSKSRLILCLVTSFIMAFTVIPFMGTANHASAEAGEYVDVKVDSATQDNPITELRFIELENGNYAVSAKIKQSIFDLSAYSKPRVFFANASKSGYPIISAHFVEKYDVYRYEVTNQTEDVLPELTPGQTVKLICFVESGNPGLDTDTGKLSYFLVNGDRVPTDDISSLAAYAITITAPKVKAEDCTHKWNSGTVTKAATCKETGVKTYTCTLCSTTKTETIAKSKTHSYSGGVCTVCGVGDVQEANNKTLGTITVKKGDSKQEYLIGQLCLDKTVNTLAFYGNPGSLVIRDSNGNKVVSGKSMFYDEDIDQYITKAGIYKVYAETQSYSNIQDYTYTVTYTLTKDINYTYMYEYLDATLNEDGTVDLVAGDFSSPTGKATTKAMYRVGGGKIIRIPWYDYDNNTRNDNIAKAYSTNYTYYAMDLDRLSAANKSVLSEVGTTSVALTSAHQTALKDPAITVSNTITTDSIELTDITDLKYTRGVKKVTLEWNWNITGGLSKELTGYRIIVNDSKGKQISKVHYAPSNLFYIRKVVTIPYEGKSKITITPYNKKDGLYSYGNDKVIECTSKTLAKPTVVGVTKISNTKVKIALKKPEGATGIYVYQKVNGNWQSRGYTTGTTFTCSKNTAGKKYYRFKAYVKDVPPGKTASKNYYSEQTASYYPKANQATYNYSKYQSDYKDYSHFWRPRKVYYSNGKLKVSGRWINTHNYRLDYFDVKVTVKYDGKIIGTKTIKCGKMGANSTKTHTAVTMSNSKSGYDLRNGQKTGKLKVTYKVIRWY